MKVHAVAAVAWIALSGPAMSDQARRCVPLEFQSNAEFRNVTEAGDVRVQPTDKVILINKAIPEATRVIFGGATSAHSPVVIVKDCSGTARIRRDDIGPSRRGSHNRWKLWNARLSPGRRSVDDPMFLRTASLCFASILGAGGALGQVLSGVIYNPDANIKISCGF
jgi:hypothetical protein